MRALILEDIPQTSDMIKERIMKFSDQYEHIDQATSLDRAEYLISENNYDVVFMDVNLPTGTSFHLLKKLANKDLINFEIVFITGQQEKDHLINAIKFSAQDFLYKPLDDNELKKALSKVENKIQETYQNEKVEVLLNLVENEGELRNSRLAFHLPKGKTVFFHTSEISHLIGEGSICHLYTDTGADFKAIRNLGYYKSFLIEQCGFIMVSKSTLINPSFVKSYDHSNLTLVLINGATLKCSRRGGKAFRDYSKSLDGNKSLWFTIKNFLRN